MKRLIFRGLEALFVWLEDVGMRGICWVDRHYPDPDIDALIAEIEGEHRENVKQGQIQVRMNFVHLPRVPDRRMH
jgi:hypothetical protein